MSRGRAGKPASIEASYPGSDGKPAGPAAADQNAKSNTKERRRRDLAAFEERIGYRFKDPALLEQA
ncbi:MAG: hypothetical protein ACM30D_04215, partial [Hyphomicrobiales bacterium]